MKNLNKFIDKIVNIMYNGIIENNERKRVKYYDRRRKRKNNGRI